MGFHISLQMAFALAIKGTVLIFPVSHHDPLSSRGYDPLIFPTWNDTRSGYQGIGLLGLEAPAQAGGPKLWPISW